MDGSSVENELDVASQVNELRPSSGPAFRSTKTSAAPMFGMTEERHGLPACRGAAHRSRSGKVTVFMRLRARGVHQRRARMKEGGGEYSNASRQRTPLRRRRRVGLCKWGAAVASLILITRESQRA